MQSENNVKVVFTICLSRHLISRKAFKPRRAEEPTLTATSCLKNQPWPLLHVYYTLRQELFLSGNGEAQDIKLFWKSVYTDHKPYRLSFLHPKYHYSYRSKMSLTKLLWQCKLPFRHFLKIATGGFMCRVTFTAYDIFYFNHRFLSLITSAPSILSHRAHGSEPLCCTLLMTSSHRRQTGCLSH